MMTAIPEQTDGVTTSNSSVEYRNAIDLADWLLDHNLSQAEHINLMKMFASNDKESNLLAFELIKVKKEQLKNIGYEHRK